MNRFPLNKFVSKAHHTTADFTALAPGGAVLSDNSAFDPARLWQVELLEQREPGLGVLEPLLELLDLPHVDLLHLPDGLLERLELAASGTGLGLGGGALEEVPVRLPGHQMQVLEVTLNKRGRILSLLELRPMTFPPPFMSSELSAVTSKGARSG